jgi:HSP20 family protein
MTEDRRMILRDNDRRGVSPFGLWSDVDDLFDAFRRDIDRMFMDPWARTTIRPIRVRTANTYMPMNLEDEGENLKLSVEMPGVNKDDVKLSINEDILTIGVESEERKEEDEKEYLLRERSSYRCQRSVRLPVEVQGENVDAKMEEGVLTVILPKVHPKEKKTHEINIS